MPAYSEPGRTSEQVSSIERPDKVSKLTLTWRPLNSDRGLRHLDSRTQTPDVEAPLQPWASKLPSRRVKVAELSDHLLKTTKRLLTEQAQRTGAESAKLLLAARMASILK